MSGLAFAALALAMRATADEELVLPGSAAPEVERGLPGAGLAMAGRRSLGMKADRPLLGDDEEVYLDGTVLCTRDAYAVTTGFFRHV